MNGLKYDEQKLEYDLVPWEALDDAVRVLMHGKKKYGPWNWKEVFPRDRYYKAMQRHAIQSKQEYLDESGLPHLAHVIVNALFLLDRSKCNRCYIAGPISGKEGNNEQAFFEAEQTLYEMGFEPVNPLRISEEVEKRIEEPSYRDYMRADIIELVGCSHIYLLEGWGKSSGAFLEYQIAVHLKMGVMFEGEQKYKEMCDE